MYIPLWIIEYLYDGESFKYYSYAEIQNVYTKPRGNKIEAQATEKQQTVLDNFAKRESVITRIENFGCLGIFIIGSIICCELSTNYVENHGEGENGGNYLWLFITIGIIFLFTIGVVKNYFRRKDGIEDIENDIANRTNILQNEADNYRQETGKVFLNKYFR